MEVHPPKPAATLILIRNPARAPRFLVGRRADDATFMPGSYVFPGGAVDEADFHVVPDFPLPQSCATALGHPAYAIAALRELREETGLTIGQGIDLSGLRYVFRAVTPATYPKRFDARFFVADATTIRGDLDLFAPEHPELTDIHWASLRDLDVIRLPSITRFVLNGVVKHLPSLDAPIPVPEIGL